VHFCTHIVGRPGNEASQPSTGRNPGLYWEDHPIVGLPNQRVQARTPLSVEKATTLPTGPQARLTEFRGNRYPIVVCDSAGVRSAEHPAHFFPQLLNAFVVRFSGKAIPDLPDRLLGFVVPLSEEKLSFRFFFQNGFSRPQRLFIKAWSCHGPQRAKCETCFHILGEVYLRIVLCEENIQDDFSFDYFHTFFYTTNFFRSNLYIE